MFFMEVISLISLYIRIMVAGSILPVSFNSKGELVFLFGKENSMENTIQKLSLAFPKSHIFGVDAIFPQSNKYYI